jgi:hypothetical protein
VAPAIARPQAVGTVYVDRKRVARSGNGWTEYKPPVAINRSKLDAFGKPVEPEATTDRERVDR